MSDVILTEASINVYFKPVENCKVEFLIDSGSSLNILNLKDSAKAESLKKMIKR